ncbi:MAG: site-2 protease family protein [Moorea sp. SIO2B7]|nr:site-2 protease family protein [Moorena sp. SIO2B7]
MNGNIRVGNLFGIPFYVNPSWFLVLALVTFSYGEELASFPQLGGITPWVLGLVTALLLFASVLAHELGHSFAAMQQGIEVKSITLFLFGGLANLEKESETPFQAFLVAIAGPLVSLLLFGLFTAIGVTIALPTPLAAIISLLASINLILALFNLIPGLPLDGGNILKAAVWQITGNPNKGVIFASRVGQFFGWLAVIVGGLAILGISPIGSFWTLLIGWFLLQNAGFSAQSARVQETLDGLTAEDAVIPNSPIISADLNLREFANDYVIGQDKWRKFLVTDEEGKLLGRITVDSLRKISTSQWTEIQVKELMQPVENIPTVKYNQSLLEIIKLLEQQEIKQLTVVGENGVVVGLLEKASVISLLQRKGQAKLA